MHSSLSISPAEEIVFAIQTICKHNNISSEDLTIVSPIRGISLYSIGERNGIGVFHSRNILSEIKIPKEMQTNEVSSIKFFQKGTEKEYKCQVGVEEFYCAYDENNIKNFTFYGPSKIIFWVIKGVQEIYPLSLPAFVFRKQDYPKVHKILLKRLRSYKHIDPPILPTNVLSDLYENTIGFLKRGQEVYKKYNIPFKRGIILAGPPGCVLGETKIRVRKKHNEGNHEMFFV